MFVIETLELQMAMFVYGGVGIHLEELRGVIGLLSAT